MKINTDDGVVYAASLSSRFTESDLDVNPTPRPTADTGRIAVTAERSNGGTGRSCDDAMIRKAGSSQPGWSL